jgi:iron complex transport system substrate-binding protein
MMNKTPAALFSAIMLCAALLASCDKPQTERIADSRGRGTAVEIPVKKDRVISAMPSNTEILVDLGLADRIVALDKYSKGIAGIDENLPVIDIMYPDIEFIASLNPDMIIAHGMSRVGAGDDPFAVLRSAGIAVVYLTMSNSIDGIYNDIAFTANLFDVQQRGQELIALMKADIAAVADIGKTITHKKTVYFEIEPPPAITSFGGGTYLNEMIELVGAENIFKTEKGIIFPSIEQILVRNPDVLITNVDYIPDPINNLRNRTGFEYISAVQNNMVFHIDADSSSRPTRNIIKALKELAKDIYPEFYASL